MKLLQHICLSRCESLLRLPCSIGKLRHLRFLDLTCTPINNVPRGFGGLINLRKLYGFPAHIDGNWCSLEELGPLGKLTALHINGLENISSTLFVRKARLFEKMRLRNLHLTCSIGRCGDDGLLLKEHENVSNNEQRQIEEVFDELCPPSCLETLSIFRYFGRRLPRWLMSAADTFVGSLRTVTIEDLPFCIELPDDLCHLPSLEYLHIKGAPAIKRVGPEFLQPHYHEHPSTLENIGSALKIQVVQCLNLERIGNLKKMQELVIVECPKLKVLEGMPALRRLCLGDYNMETLPQYLQHVNPRHLLEIDCDVSVLTSIAVGKSGPEWDKFSHIKQVKAYAHDDDNDIQRKWYVMCTRDPFSFKTNINHSAILQARKERVQRLCLAYSQSCPIEEEWAVGRADVDKLQPLCQRFRCNAYRHLVPWLRRVCLHCCEAGRIATSSDQWTEAAEYRACHKITLTAQRFARTQRT